MLVYLLMFIRFILFKDHFILVLNFETPGIVSYALNTKPNIQLHQSTTTTAITTTMACNVL